MGEREKERMAQTPEPAASAGGRTKFGRWRTAIVAAGIVLVAFLGVLPLEACRDVAFICENTGSQKGYREWRPGLRTGVWYRESHLEQFLRQQHPSDLTYRWTCCQGTGRNIFGQSRSFGHGFPRIHTIMLGPGWFDRYVDTLDGAAKLSLHQTLVSADPEAIRAEEKKIEEMAVTNVWPLR